MQPLCPPRWRRSGQVEILDLKLGPGRMAVRGRHQFGPFAIQDRNAATYRGNGMAHLLGRSPAVDERGDPACGRYGDQRDDPLRAIAYGERDLGPRHDPKPLLQDGRQARRPRKDLRVAEDQIAFDHHRSAAERPRLRVNVGQGPWRVLEHLL